MCSEGHPMVIRLGRNGKFLACSLYPEHKETRPLPGEEAPKLEGDGEPCPQCGEGTLATKRGRFGAFVGCSRYPDCTYIQQGRPAAARPAAVRGHVPQERRRARWSRVARGAPGTSSGGAPNYPQVRLHDATTSRPARSTTPTTDGKGAVARRARATPGCA